MLTAATTWGAFNWVQAPWNAAALTFAYDSEHHRVEMTAPAGSTYYFNDAASGASAEYYVPATGAAQWRDYLVADRRMVAERVATLGGSAAMQYFVADHLGSIAVVTDASGQVIQRMVYDPWGAQLAGDGSPLCGAGPTTRGYTGEEQMPADCLVNLNARVYDPILGRFLSGDSVIGNVYDGQSLNRYGYVLNNPLSLTDTNGECPICLVFLFGILDVAAAEIFKPLFEHVPLLGDLFVIANGIVCGPVLGPVCAAEAAGSIARVQSGSVGKGLEAFVLTFAEAEAFKFVGDDLEGLKALNSAGLISDFRYYSTAFIEHGLVGGTFSALQGGNFGSGFLAAGVSELASPYVDHNNLVVGAVESAVVGGTTSAIGGGKFGDGAVTGAFGYLDNYCAHQKCWLTAGESATLQQSGAVAFYQQLCADHDPYACFAAQAASPDTLWGAIITQRLSDAYTWGHATEFSTDSSGNLFPENGFPSDALIGDIRLQLAQAYANLLSGFGPGGGWPTADAIKQTHWTVFGNFGLPADTFGGTPLPGAAFSGASTWFTAHVFPGWCPTCH